MAAWKSCRASGARFVVLACERQRSKGASMVRMTLPLARRSSSRSKTVATCTRSRHLARKHAHTVRGFGPMASLTGSPWSSTGGGATRGKLMETCWPFSK
eukprot:3864910-Lingulodinium_polyedra.AAC.1